MYINGEPYIYVRNSLGDILEVRDKNGTLKAKYAYDAWGNCKVITNVDGIADENPFRYRGYYYDSENGLYYLMSRYYDPEIGRFLNADDLMLLSQLSSEINGLNLYAYCLNNPVMHKDPSGKFVLSMFLLIVGINVVFSAIDGGITASMSGQSFWKGFAAGAIGGLVQGIISQVLPLPSMVKNYIGRILNTAIYGILNEIFQNGSLKNMDWGILATDAVLDSIAYIYYGPRTNELSKILGTIVGGLIESGIDILETYLFYSPQAKERIRSFSNNNYNLCEV